MNKIFFADLDGTLLTSKKDISPLTRSALYNFIEDGNYFVINTGRSPVSAKKICEANELLGLKRLYIGSFNGGMLLDGNTWEVLVRNTMDIEDVPILFKMFDDANVACQTYSDTHILSHRDTPGLRFFRSIEPDPYMIVDDISKALEVAPCKILGTTDDKFDELDAMRKVIHDRFGDKYYTMYSDPHYLEVMPKTYGKGSLIDSLCKILNIPVSDTFAAGDQENDIHMFDAAGLSVAMLNGVEAAKKAADRITKADNDHDGLVEILEEYTG